MDPQTPPKDFVVIGKVVSTFGLKGFLKVWPLTDFPERFDAGETIWIAGEPRRIREVQWHNKQARVRLEGVSRLVLAQALVGQEISVDAKDKPDLEQGEYMIDDLVGMKVVDEQGTLLGTLDQIIQARAHDIYRVGEAMIPAVSEFVKSVDLGSRIIVVAPIPGMFDDAG
ncbi:MAG: 16S rRNA processing protein RimM [Armatimonadetes bacterium]|nr:16S rRNA processing protein RimM [Armatimonadota bacterium]